MRPAASDFAACTRARSEACPEGERVRWAKASNADTFSYGAGWAVLNMGGLRHVRAAAPAVPDCRVQVPTGQRSQARASAISSSAEVLRPGAEVDFVALAGEERGWMGWLSSGTKSFR